jgi:photosystem I P700 chlorophyll a apoprotein A1
MKKLILFVVGVITLATDLFAQSANTINGWLRDFLWAQSSQVIQSYGSALSAYGLVFLGAHFIWAFSLMFLFSGRGYWQELIESIVWAHNKLKVGSIFLYNYSLYTKLPNLIYFNT